MKIAGLLLLCLAWIPLQAEDHPKEYYDPDVQKLIATPVFTFRPVGYVGVMSDGEKAFAAIVKKKEAVRYMVAAFDAGSPEARCYALVALREWSDALYDQCDEKLRTNPPATIRTMEGSVITELPTAKVLQDIYSGVYRKYLTQHEAEK